MMHCLVCNTSLREKLSWSTLWIPPSNSSLCKLCLDQLKSQREASRCDYCFGIIQNRKQNICRDCQFRLTSHQTLLKNRSLYSYNDVVKQLIARWKYRGDYEIGLLFKQSFYDLYLASYGQMKRPLIVPIPLHEKRLYERAFNQAEQLASFLPYPQRNILSRLSSEKQAKKTRKERLASKNPFVALETVQNDVILVDDIYTTGTTIYQAASVLRAAGARSVSSLTLVRR